jgi:hypothetical protein
MLWSKGHQFWCWAISELFLFCFSFRIYITVNKLEVLLLCTVLNNNGYIYVPGWIQQKKLPAFRPFSFASHDYDIIQTYSMQIIWMKPNILMNKSNNNENYYCNRNIQIESLTF